MQCDCPGDISGGGVVDPFDLNKVLAEWCSVLNGNPCGTCGGQGAQGGGGPGSGPSLTTALAQMGFQSVGAYQGWLTAASNSEAFASVSQLLALLEAQP